MDTETDLWKHLADNPFDDAAKLALADLLIERGDEYTARALKWCVGRKKWPHRYADGYRHWNWTIDWRLPKDRHELPQGFGEFIPLVYSTSLSKILDSLGESFRRMDELMSPHRAG